MITGDIPEIEAYADKEVMLVVNAAMSGDVSHDVSHDVTPQPTPSGQSTDVTPAPVVIEDGKITINTDTASDDSVKSIVEIIANLTDEEKRNITKLEINSEVQSLEWIGELEDIEELTLSENASVEELDLSGNAAIKELNAYGANVKSLNLSGCAKLVSLDCSSCGLESINLDGCTSLRSLNIRDNGLLMFDAGDLANLHELICDSQVVYMKLAGKIFALGEYFSAASFVSSASGMRTSRISGYLTLPAAK